MRLTPQPPVTLHGVAFHPHANQASGAKDLAAWRADFAPRTPGQPHRMTEEEVLLVLTGNLSFEVDDAAFAASAGEAVLVPSGALLRVSNDTDGPASAWVCTRLGMRATMADGTEIVPPWAQ